MNHTKGKSNIKMQFSQEEISTFGGRSMNVVACLVLIKLTILEYTMKAELLAF